MGTERSIRTAVVTGATSFLGSAVVRALLDRGCTVYGLVRPESQARAMLPIHPRFHEIRCAISETENWTEAVGKADTFFHFAWGGPGEKGRADEVVQGQSAEDALTCIRGAGMLGVSRFFLSGSQAEYGKVQGITTEETPCRPFSAYGKNKLRVNREGPALAATLGMEYVHARFFSVYGPHDHPYALIPSCIRCFLSDGVMELSDCTHQWNFLHVRDAAEAALRLGECALESDSLTVNLASTDTRPLRSFVEEIHRLAGGKGVCRYGARRGAEQPVDNCPDVSLLLSLTGWHPRISFSEGITELIETERAAGMGERTHT